MNRRPSGCIVGEEELGNYVAGRPFPLLDPQDPQAGLKAVWNLRYRDPEEKMFPLIVQFAVDEKFFVGSDYPHAEGFVHPVQKTRELLAALPTVSVGKILGDNARNFYGI